MPQLIKADFEVGQRVKQKNDDGDGSFWVYGRVTKITKSSVFVLWNDPDVGEMEIEIPDADLEFEKIYLGIPG